MRRVYRRQPRHRGTAAGKKRRLTAVTRQRAEALRDSEEKYRRLFEATNDIIMTADTASWRVVDANRAAERALGWSREELHGMHISEMAPPAKRQMFCRVFASHVAAGGNAQPEQIVLRMKNGAALPLEVVSTVLPVGEATLIVGVFRDISQRLQLEEELDQYWSRLEDEVCIRNAELSREIDIRKEAQLQLAHRLDLEQLLTFLSTLLIKLSPAEMDVGLAYILERVGSMLCCDRVWYFHIEQDRSAFSFGSEWCRQGIDSSLERLRHVPCHSIAWTMAKYERNEIVHLDDIGDLTSGAQGKREVMRLFGARSLAAVPIFCFGRPAAFLGVDTLGRQRCWSTPELEFLQVLAGILSQFIERCRTAATLQESERKFQAICEQTDDGIAVLDPMPRHTPVLVDFNRAFCEMHGYSREELIGQPLTLLVDGLTSDQRQRLVERMLADETVLFEVEHVKKDGSRFSLEVSARRLDFNGKTFLYSIARDITPRKRAEEAIRFQNLILETQQEASPDGILLVDRRGRVISHNRRFVTMWDIPLEILDSRDDREYLNWAQRFFKSPEAVLGEIERIYAQPALTKQDSLALTDGRVVERYTAPVTDPESGNYYGRLWFFRDVTERERSAALLRASEERFRTIFEHNIDGIAVVEEESGDSGALRLVECNDSFADIADRSREELLASSDLREHFQVLEKERRTLSSQADAGLISWQRPDGRENYVAYNRVPITLDGRECLLCVQRDVTQARQAEEKILKLSRRVVQAAEKERMRIARDLHDELGQFVPSLQYRIGAVAHMLPAESEEVHARLADLSGIVEKLAVVGHRLAATLRPGLLDRLGLIPALKWYVNDFVCRNASLDVGFRVNGAQKQLPPEIEIVLYRVFQESLTNIGKHAAATRVAVNLTFSHPHVILVIEDDGCGFGEGPPAADTDGNGLGLLGMKERVASVGGRLQIRSSSEQGSMIRMVLPTS